MLQQTSACYPIKDDIASGNGYSCNQVFEAEVVMDTWTVLLELAVIIGVALVAGVLFERIKLNALTGFLLAGILIGPGGFHIISNIDMVALLAELGVSLLLFTIGLEFSIRRLSSLGLKTLLIGLLQISLTIAAFTGLFYSLGFEFPIALTIGLIAAPSSTAVALRVMREDDSIDSPSGRITLGVLLLQDLAIVPLVLVVSSLAKGGGFLSMSADFGVAIGLSALLFAGFWVVIRFVMPLFLNTTANSGNRDLFIMLATVIFVAAVWLAHYFKISPALGAFAAGVLLAESPFAAQIRADVSALRALFVTFFFVSAGMLANVGEIIDNIAPLAGLLLGFIVLKIVLIFLITLLMRQPLRHGMAVAFSLGMIGEFSFLLLDVATREQLLPKELSMLLLSSTILSLMASPFLVRYAPAIGRGAEKLAARLGLVRGIGKKTESTEVPERGHFLIIGLGPAGQQAIKRLREGGAAIVALDLNPRLVKDTKEQGIHAMVGDAIHPEVLEHMHATSAAAIVVTIPDRAAILNIIRQVRSVCPNTPIVARSRWNRFSEEIIKAGATHTIDEESNIGESLSDVALRYF